MLRAVLSETSGDSRAAQSITAFGCCLRCGWMDIRFAGCWTRWPQHRGVQKCSLGHAIVWAIGIEVVIFSVYLGSSILNLWLEVLRSGDDFS